MNFEIEPQPYDENEKELKFDVFFNKEKIITRGSLSQCLEKIKVVVEAIVHQPENKKKKENEK